MGQKAAAIAALIGLVLALAAGLACAVDRTWIGSEGDAFTAAASWAPSGIPSGDDALTVPSGAGTINVTAAATCGSLVVANGTTFVFDSGAIIEAESLYFAGSVATVMRPNDGVMASASTPRIQVTSALSFGAGTTVSVLVGATLTASNTTVGDDATVRLCGPSTTLFNEVTLGQRSSLVFCGPGAVLEDATVILQDLTGGNLFDVEATGELEIAGAVEFAGLSSPFVAGSLSIDGNLTVGGRVGLYLLRESTAEMKAGATLTIAEEAQVRLFTQLAGWEGSIEVGGRLWIEDDAAANITHSIHVPLDGRVLIISEAGDQIVVGSPAAASTIVGGIGSSTDLEEVTLVIRKGTVVSMQASAYLGNALVQEGATFELGSRMTGIVEVAAGGVLSKTSGRNVQMAALVLGGPTAELHVTLVSTTFSAVGALAYVDANNGTLKVEATNFVGSGNVTVLATTNFLSPFATFEVTGNPLPGGGAVYQYNESVVYNHGFLEPPTTASPIGNLSADGSESGAGLSTGGLVAIIVSAVVVVGALVCCIFLVVPALRGKGGGHKSGHKHHKKRHHHHHHGSHSGDKASHEHGGGASVSASASAADVPLTAAPSASASAGSSIAESSAVAAPSSSFEYEYQYTYDGGSSAAAASAESSLA